MTEQRCDLLLRGGTIVDGSGRPGFRADVAVRDGRIVALGDLAGSAAGLDLDVAGLVVCPGFIDLHSHSDTTLLVDGRGLSKVMQGVNGQAPGGAYIVGLDADTGAEAWRFYSIARPGEPGGDSWNGLPLEQRTGGSVWTAGS